MPRPFLPAPRWLRVTGVSEQVSGRIRSRADGCLLPTRTLEKEAQPTMSFAFCWLPAGTVRPESRWNHPVEGHAIVSLSVWAQQILTRATGLRPLRKGVWPLGPSCGRAGRRAWTGRAAPDRPSSCRCVFLFASRFALFLISVPPMHPRLFP